ncbi:TonB-dependent receptor [Fibrisoma limi BUZ 3]|uniref:TonB-dependent receptor n=1 Tax=Fibrisoma limi BUZ 3 TaxID=1185876 RepID=I2GC67_9BACT|nr:SusC/RagA family TonB-linked outer membrane protein [Fibrisoma limi]CCH51491.1 TonB-dependent receptor [Fibrisoma limi BUZ 3]
MQTTTYRRLARFVLWSGMCLLHAVAFAQTTVSGTIRSENGTPIPGANIVVKGTSTGTTSTADGTYTLNVSQRNATLVFSSIGFQSKEVAIGSGNTLNVTLTEDVANLEEVVVTGLATSIKRSNLANAISTVSAKELIGTTQIQTVDNALYGKLTGVNINTNGGAPGGGVSVQLRGISSLVGASQPLYIIDGVYANNAVNRNGRGSVTGASGVETQDDAANRISDLNPNDIETVEVLKGPSAAAIYGTRANAGVIIITTKRGTAGKTRLTFAQDYGFAVAQRLLGVDSWSEDKINTFFAAARRPVELDRFRASNGQTYDYEKYFYGNTAPLSNTRLGLSGGNDKTRFYISGAFTNEKGIIRRTGFERYSIRANIDHKLTQDITLSVGSNYINTNTDRGFTGNQNNSGASIGYNIAYVPNYFSLFPDASGRYPDNPYFSENPVAVTDRGINNSNVNRFIQSFNLTANLYKSERVLLKLIGQGGLDFAQNTTQVYLPEDLQFQRAQGNPGDVIWGKTENVNTNLQAALVFNWNVNRVNLTSQVGVVRLNFREDRLLNRSRGLAGGQNNLRQGTVQEIFDQRFQKVTDVGVFAQQEANWEDKIIATVGVRWDKSTLIGDANRFWAFPKASLAVNVANFNFIRSSGLSTIFSQIKPRVAYGETAGVPAFGTTFTPLNSANIGGLLGSVVTTAAGNNAIEPERAGELEFGLDLGLFNNRISLEATYYDKQTRSNIQNLQLSPAVGISTIPTNLAQLQNRGVELALSVVPAQLINFRWNTRLMWWRNNLLLTRLGIPPYNSGAFGVTLGTFLYQEGFSPTTIVGTRPARDASDTPLAQNVRTGAFILGNSQPDFQMSWLNEFTLFGKIDVNMLWHWKQGGDNINLTQFLMDSGGTTPDWDDDDNGDGTPNGRQRGLAPHNGADRWVQDASYVRLREVAVYYNLPVQSFGKWFSSRISRIRIGASSQNPLTFTNYFGYDPETSTFGVQAVGSGVDIAPYPTQRRFFGHLVVEF